MKPLLTQAAAFVNENSIFKNIGLICLLVGLPILVACGGVTVTKVETAVATDPRLWCTENVCIVKDFGAHVDPKLLDMAQERLFCSRRGVAVTVLETDLRYGRATRLAVVCPD